MTEATGLAFALGGVASSAQANAFLVGLMGAAMFARYSLKAGFATVAVLLLRLAGLVSLAVREPAVEK